MVAEFEMHNGWDSVHSSCETFTVALVELPEGVDARFDGMSGRPVHSVRSRVTPPPGAPLHLESVELERHAKLYMTKAQDPVAARELLGPQLITALAVAPVLFDQRGDVLLVARHGTSRDPAFHDGLVVDAVFLARHFASQVR